MKKIYNIIRKAFAVALIAFVIGGLPSRHLEDQLMHLIPAFAFIGYLVFNHNYLKCKIKETEDEMPKM